MACFGAVISYAMQCASFIFLRRRLPNIERPYRSPVGEWGAAIAGVIALVSLLALFMNDAYRPGVYGTAAYFVLGVIYFAIYGRHRLLPFADEALAPAGGPPRPSGTGGYRPRQRGHLSGRGATTAAQTGAVGTVGR